jgi:NAD(P)H-dependent FMN reductase
MPTIVGIAGSLRVRSYNLMLLSAAIELAPAGTTVSAASIKDIPLYDGDLEAAHGSPEPVEALKQAIMRSDGVLLVTPEYNNSIPGVMKNAIDWTSRPPTDTGRVYRGKPIGVIGATPGPGGTGLSQAAWLPVLRALGTVPFFGPRIMVAHAAKVFDEHGKLTDPAVRTQLASYLEAFAQFVARQTR